MNSSGRKGHFVDTWEKLLQLLKNDKEALENVQFETIDGVKTGVDPYEKTPMTTCGKNKHSFDKLNVKKPTTDGGKSTPPYSDPQQKLECRGSTYNVPGLHLDPDEVARIRNLRRKNNISRISSHV